MQRYFIAKEQFGENSVHIGGDDARHIQQVMRFKIGDRFICSDGVSEEALVEITRLQPGQVTAAIIERLAMNNEPAVSVWIGQSLPKGDKMETVIQRCTEIGATRFYPFTSARTIVKYDGKKEGRRLLRWGKIAKEAAEQAQRNRIPHISEPLTWSQMLQWVGKADLAFICYEQAKADDGAHSLKHWLQQQAEPAQSVLLLIGPEGGFSEEEVAEAVAAGCHIISLGRRILRTETAAIAALSCILYEYGEMGG